MRDPRRCASRTRSAAWSRCRSRRPDLEPPQRGGAPGSAGGPANETAGRAPTTAVRPRPCAAPTPRTAVPASRMSASSPIPTYRRGDCQEEVGRGERRRDRDVVDVADAEERPMSGSCGCALRGSTKKRTARILPSATIAAIWASPPSGPESRVVTSSPIFSLRRRPVVASRRGRTVRGPRVVRGVGNEVVFFPSCAITARLGRNRHEGLRNDAEECLESTPRGRFEPPANGAGGILSGAGAAIAQRPSRSWCAPASSRPEGAARARSPTTSSRGAPRCPELRSRCRAHRVAVTRLCPLSPVSFTVVALSYDITRALCSPYCGTSRRLDTLRQSRRQSCPASDCGRARVEGPWRRTHSTGLRPLHQRTRGAPRCALPSTVHPTWPEATSSPASPFVGLVEGTSERAVWR